jgi:hypothetical protein
MHTETVTKIPSTDTAAATQVENEPTVNKWTANLVLPLLTGILLNKHSKADVAEKIGKPVNEVEILLRQHFGELMLQLSRIHILANSVRSALEKGIADQKKLMAYVDICSDDMKSVVDSLEALANPV